MQIALAVQVISAAIIQHYSEQWFLLTCFALLLANLYYLYHCGVQTLCVLNDEIVLRFLAAETKAGITEDDLKAAYAKRLAIVGPQEAKRIEKRRYVSSI